MTAGPHLTQYLRRAFAYDAWANRDVAARLAGASPPPARAIRWLAHIAGAEWLWHARVVAASPRLAVWPDLDIVQCSVELEAVARAWKSFLAPLAMRELLEPVRYVNSKGEPWTSTLQDVLFHVVVHSAYHRGQIAADVRSAGHEPAYTDFIHATRQGLVAPWDDAAFADT